MEQIYIYDGYFEKGIKGNKLIKKSAKAYLNELGMDETLADEDIIRPDQGKPYFKTRPFEFSLSHSGALWMCMFSQSACGLDVQIIKECDYEKLADRFYTEKEKHYVDLWGISGFFDLWVRREAFAKCTGNGIFAPIPELVSENTELIEKVEFNSEIFYFKDIFISDEIKCAICSKSEIEPEMRALI